MLKTAHVELVGKTLVGGGLVTTIVTGDVGAVTAAVEAGAAAVTKLDRELLVSRHIIPRPHNDIASIVVASASPAVEQQIPRQNESSILSAPDAITTIITDTIISAESSVHATPTMADFHKEEVDDFVQRFGLENGMTALRSLSVVKLRNLAREYKEISIAGRAIAKANKELLIQSLKEYYARGSTQ
jgi:microcompartment protein CcmL/EutN